MRDLIKRELARVLRAVAEHLDHEQRLSPEADELLRKGCEDAKEGRVSPLPPERLAEPPTFIPVPYPCPYPAPPIDVRPWPGYPGPYIGDPWPPTYPTITWTSDSLVIPVVPAQGGPPMGRANRSDVVTTYTVEPWDGLCQVCHERPGTINVTGCPGGLSHECPRCIVEASLKHAREQAARIPYLEAELEQLTKGTVP